MNQLYKGFIFFALFVSYSYSCLSNSNYAELFSTGNQLYQEKEYEKAITAYDSILSGGFESTEVYFNLGNAYYKSGMMPHAILNYERARKMSPGDEDVLYNLKLANLRIIDRIEQLPTIFFVRWHDAIISMQNSKNWAIFSIISAFVFFLGMTIYLFSNNLMLRIFSFYSGTFAMILAAIFVIFSSNQNNYETNEREAILFTPAVYVKSAPNSQSTDLFLLHEGIHVTVLDKLKDWNKIKLKDGKIGWLQDSDIVVI